MKILFLSTHNLATNPRLVKEINLAVKQNYEVEVICYIFRNWSYEMNAEMLKEFGSKGIKFHCIESGKEAGPGWFVSILKEKWARLLSKMLLVKNGILANSVSRRNMGLLAAIKKISSADWVIGHNPGALWATLYAGKKLDCKMGFDVEDYHSGEGNDAHLKKLTERLMGLTLPKMNYVSFAAPLIKEQVQKDIGTIPANWITILNYFPAEEFIAPAKKKDDILRLVWFSQNINAGRGLELILPNIYNHKNVELHLFGNADSDFKEKYLDSHDNIVLHRPLPQKDLHQKLSFYDVGLSLDIPAEENRDLTITNKLLAYLQAGLFVVTTDTKAQASFIKETKAGCIKINPHNNSIDVVDELLKKQNEILSDRQSRYCRFKACNWETESSKLTNIWEG